MSEVIQTLKATGRDQASLLLYAPIGGTVKSKDDSKSADGLVTTLWLDWHRRPGGQPRPKPAKTGREKPAAFRWIDIAPTLAAIAEAELPQAQGEDRRASMPRFEIPIGSDR